MIRNMNGDTDKKTKKRQRKSEAKNGGNKMHTDSAIVEKIMVYTQIKGPRFESGRGRCVESLDKALYSHCSPGEAFTLASISYLAILVKYILAKKEVTLRYLPFHHASQTSCQTFVLGR